MNNTFLTVAVFFILVILMLLCINPSLLLDPSLLNTPAVTPHLPIPAESKIPPQQFVAMAEWITLATLAATGTGFIIALISLVSINASVRESERLRKDAETLKKQAFLAEKMADRSYKRFQVVVAMRKKFLKDVASDKDKTDQEKILARLTIEEQVIRIDGNLNGLESKNIDDLKNHLKKIGQHIGIETELLSYIHLAFEHGLFDEDRLGKRAYEVEALYKEVVKKLEPRTY